MSVDMSRLQAEWFREDFSVVQALTSKEKLDTPFHTSFMGLLSRNSSLGGSR